MALKINIDAAALASAFKELALEVEQDIQKGVANLAAMTHAKTAELAAQGLHKSFKDYKDALGFEEISPGIWVVSVGEKALWIEEGVEPNHDMKPDLLKNATKVSKDGHRYRSIPFDYGQASGQLNQQTLGLVNQIKQKLKAEKIPFKKIEKNADGSPKVGKLHAFDIKSAIPGKGNTPALKGVSIYQTVTKTGNVRRDILTFRTVSDGPGSAGKWIHPGYEKKQFLDEAAEWALKEWENTILPSILDKWK